jgi:polyhydroxyalkanoate synthesis regulator phasin
VGTTAKRAATQTSRASSDSVATLAEQIVRGRAKSRDVLMLTRERIQETLDDAASRGRVTRKDANELVSELVRRGRSQSDEVLSQIGQLASGGRDQLGSAGRKVRKNEGVDRVVRGADRARRTVGVGPAFPILGYDDLNAPQVKSRIKELDRPELRKVLSYERKHANRKSVVGALEKTLG